MSGADWSDTKEDLLPASKQRLTALTNLQALRSVDNKHLGKAEAQEDSDHFSDLLADANCKVVSTTGDAFINARDQNNTLRKQIGRVMGEPESCIREVANGCLEVNKKAPVLSSASVSSLRPETVSKRPLGSQNTYNLDAGTVNNASGGGYHNAADLAATGGSDSGRVSSSSLAGSSGPANDAGSFRSGELRRQAPSAAASASAAPPAAAPPKRGGFKDGGGVAVEGELPTISPIAITSERELRAEFETITATLSLAPNTDWQARMDAMQRVEGLILGGATEYDCFHEALKGLAQTLSQQFKERRSTIARQACHLIGVLARATGHRFESHALILLPTLFTVVPITIAIMAESANTGVREVLRHCQTGRVLQTVSDGICKEKNPKTRQYCASFLIQILEEWDVSFWSRHVEPVEAAIRSAAQDSTAETRQSSRTAMSLYQKRQPDRARLFLEQLDGALRNKLAVEPATTVAAKPTFSRKAINAAFAASQRVECPVAVAAPQETSDADLPSGGAVRRRPNSTLPVRVPVPAPTGPPPAATSRVTSGTATRVPCTPAPEAPPTRPLDAPPSRPSSATVATTHASARQGGSGVQERPANMAETKSMQAGAGGGLVPLSRVVSTILGGPRSWNDKVEALSALTAHVRASLSGASASFGRRSGSGADEGNITASFLAVEPEKVAQALERVRERIMEALEDPHHKVLGATLQLLLEVVRSYGNVLEGQLDRLLPVLLNKGAEQKEPARSMCMEVLNECGEAYRPEVLVPTLSKCLDVVKLVRAKQTVMEFFRAHVGQWGVINSTQLKHWLVRLGPLLEDRAPELRKRAAEVLDALLAAPWAREPITYVAYQHNSPDVAPLRRYLMSLQSTGALVSAAPTASCSGINAISGLTDTMGSLQLLQMTVTGSAPATTSDSRRQLASATPPVPVSVPSHSNQPTPLSGVNNVAYGATEARPASSSGGDGRARLSRNSSQLASAGSTSATLTGANMVSTGLRAVAQASSMSAHASPAAQHLGVVNPIPAPSPAYGMAGAQTPVGTLQTQACLGDRRPGRVAREPVSQTASLDHLLAVVRSAVARCPNAASSAGLNEVTTAMENLLDAVSTFSKDSWVRAFPLLMVDVNAWVQHPAQHVRFMAFALLKELLVRQPHVLTDNNMESQFKLLLSGCNDEAQEVLMTAGQALEVLLKVCNGRHAMLLLQRLLPLEYDMHRQGDGKGKRLVPVVKAISQLAARLSRQELQTLSFTPHPQSGQTLLEGLTTILADPAVSVRRATVLALAELWYHLGSTARDYMQELLSNDTYNIVCIYYLKRHGIKVSADERASEHPLVLKSNVPA